MSDTNLGSDIREIANEAWDSERGEYRGLEWHMAVTKCTKEQEKRGPDGKKIKRKLRREEGAKVAHSIFDNARAKKWEGENLDKAAQQALAVGPVSDTGFSAVGNEELQEFASDVISKVQRIESSGFGLDLTMIIGLISTIVQAVQACRKPTTT